jgi:hypothetical protein
MQQLILETVVTKKYVRHHHDAQTKKINYALKYSGYKLDFIAH